MSIDPITPLRCFFEWDTSAPLLRRSLVEGVGTCFLVAVMVGAGLATIHGARADRLSASLAIAISIAGALAGLIVAFGKVSGGHFNPLITLAQWISGERNTACTLSYVLSQIIGGIVGSKIAGFIFGVESSETVSIASPNFSQACSEAVASCGLMIVVMGCARSAKWETGPFAVGAWLTAAILATPTASYANPAVTIGAIFGAGPTALTAGSALVFVLAQLAGALLAKIVILIAYPPNNGATA